MDMDLFSRNIEALKRTSPTAAAAVLATNGAPEGVEFLNSRSGKLTARFMDPDGDIVHLHSAFDPEKEAVKFTFSRSLIFGKWIIWVGPGLWYGIREMMKRMHHNPFCVIEPNPALLRAVMERMPLYDLFDKPGLRVITGSVEQILGELSSRPLVAAARRNMVVSDLAARMMPDAYQNLTVSLWKIFETETLHTDAENVVRREVFGDMEPDGFRILISSKNRYSDAVEQTFTPLGVRVETIFDFPDTESILDFKPDLIFSFSTNLMTWPDTLMLVDGLKQKLGIPLVIWNTEDPLFYYVSSRRELLFKAARTADLYFTQSKQLFDTYRSEGVEALYLPTAARPEMAGDPLPLSEQTLDFSFFGGWTTRRKNFFGELTERLSYLKFRMVEPGMAPEDFRDMIRHTRVNLTAFTCCDMGDEDNWAVSDRVWEVPYAGGFILQDKRRHLMDHFAPEEVAVFDNLDECADKIRYFAGHPEERVRIMEDARARVRAEHLWSHRMETVVEHLLKRNLIGGGAARGAD
jgi:hypothetical protein